MIKVGINLATQPFRRDRPVIVIGSVLGTALVALLAVLIYLSVSERGERAEARHGVDQLQRRLRTVAAEQAKLEAVLRKPENAEVLERSLFLNALLYRKGISWTRIFADLEKVVPYNVRIMQIRPTLNSKNEVVLDMQVGTENPEPLINLLKALEDSPLFGPAYLHTSAPPSQSEPLWKYRISVNYAQKLGLAAPVSAVSERKAAASEAPASNPPASNLPTPSPASASAPGGKAPGVSPPAANPPAVKPPVVTPPAANPPAVTPPPRNISGVNPPLRSAPADNPSGSATPNSVAPVVSPNSFLPRRVMPPRVMPGGNPPDGNAPTALPAQPANQDGVKRAQD